MNHKNNSGNVLIFILIAVALLGALTAMLSRSSDTTSDTGSFERKRVSATEILNYTRGIEDAIGRIQSLNGCSENELSFDNAFVSGYSNTDAPTDESCHVFSSKGGGQNYKEPSENWLDTAQDGETGYQEWIFSGYNEAFGVGTDCSASACRDLIVFLPYVQSELCTNVNKLVGVTNPSSVPPQEDDTFDLGKFTGDFPAGSILQMTGNETDYKKTGCFQGNGQIFNGKNPGTGTYHIYHVLLSR